MRTLFAPTLTVALVAMSACTTLPQRQDRGDPSPQDSIESTLDTDATAAPVPRRGTKELAPGYLVEINNLEDEKLNGKFRIDQKGVLKLPYNITINVDGLTESELHQKLIEAYRPYFKKTPAIQVTVAEKKYWIEIRGLIEKPGQYLINKEASLDEIIVTGGGLQKGEGSEPLAKYVQIKQKAAAMVIKLSDYYTGSQSFSPQWIGGDALFFQSERPDVGTPSGLDPNYVQMLGEVKAPGEYLFKESADFLYYLAKAGGPTESAALNKLEIIRTRSGRKVSIMFSTEKLNQMPLIQGGDLIIVHPDRPSSFATGAGIAASFAAVIGVIVALIVAL